MLLETPFEVGMPAMPVMVLDTNVVLNYAFFQEPATVALINQLLRTHRWCSTPWMQLEASRVASSRALVKYATPSTLAQLAACFAQHATMIADDAVPADIATGVLRCRDSDDQIFLDVALYTQAVLLLTLDRDLLKLKKRAASLQPVGLRIVEPFKMAV
jgi:putative PIN family toxin of toxin-antitoxin system